MPKNAASKVATSSRNPPHRPGLGGRASGQRNALIALGRTHAELTAALLAALAAARLASVGRSGADLVSRVGKGAGVDTAVRAVAELAPLIGAAGFQAPVRRARRSGQILFGRGEGALSNYHAAMRTKLRRALFLTWAAWLADSAGWAMVAYAGKGFATLLVGVIGAAVTAVAVVRTIQALK
jgi:hypothetical protein